VKTHKLLRSVLVLTTILFLGLFSNTSVQAAEIEITSITIPVPIRGATEAAATATGIVCTVTWSPALVENKFAGDTAYTATIELKLGDDDTFKAAAANSIKVNTTTETKHPAVKAGDKVITLTATFPKTAPDPVITKEPENLDFDKGETAAAKRTIAATINLNLEETTGLTSKWMFSTDDGETWAAIAAAQGVATEAKSTNTLVIDGSLNAGTYLFRLDIAFTDVEGYTDSDNFSSKEARVRVTEKLNPGTAFDSTSVGVEAFIPSDGKHEGTDFVLDLVNEKLAGTKLVAATEDDEAEFVIKSYSFGGKWKNIGAKDKFLENGGLTKLLNKGGVLQISDNVLGNGKNGGAKGAPIPGGTIVTFATTAKRDKTPKLIVNYTALGNLPAASALTAPNTWTLTADKNATTSLLTAVLNTLEISGMPGAKVPFSEEESALFTNIATSTNKKARDWKGFMAEFVDGDNDLRTIKSLAEKPFKTTYAVRIGSSISADGKTIKPSAKEGKITVLSEIKAPKVTAKAIKDVAGTFSITLKETMRIHTDTPPTGALSGTWSATPATSYVSGDEFVRIIPTAKKPLSAAGKVIFK